MGEQGKITESIGGEECGRESLELIKLRQSLDLVQGVGVSVCSVGGRGLIGAE